MGGVLATSRRLAELSKLRESRSSHQAVTAHALLAGALKRAPSRAAVAGGAAEPVRRQRLIKTQKKGQLRP